MKVKVCGMKESENINALVGLRPDMIGYIFYKKSMRYVGDDFKLPEIIAPIAKVGVFVNEEIRIVEKKAIQYKLDIIQLHGNESRVYCRKLKSRNPNLRIAKAISIAEVKDFQLLNVYSDCCDFFVLDSKGADYGGNGSQWDHEMLSSVEIDKDFLLSGGIDENFDFDNLSALHPRCVGIDLNSRFEISPGIKDIAKLKKYLVNES